ncbi:Coenzyme F420 hydrogenase/dehydrogenase, beta subunit C-terminal domain [Phascolarctobacterium faecium]|jgi:coenzyme F420 hydrogenase/dehydrogenase beta subunit domain protein|uniref:Coenzyme F420 hydrogenase/dehydrogenase, beta subunit C-terminal domain n=2 Tax=Phascolarctobacterium faecium TaxID=33025 RepID=UPI00210CB169|nr:Coenzyme F420 hydrogenase/dehydrogenase, beta subunit C-terminal domain [Phascolarctobacterium faecium]MCQ5185165.1 Coenzyme F420 hydrogenase/dehydrogenase, beta subunit C-terminal domain [Phascolarctobacterium faecium]
MLLKNKNQCCGCAACADICPKGAIKMLEDVEGFYYPHIDKSKCIHCGLCEKICPTINVKACDSILEAYAAYNQDEAIRLNSSSGGVFTNLAEVILMNDGVVYGAAFDKNFEVNHIKITKKEDLKRLRGSKYVQSKCDGIYKNVKKDLISGREVLFTGTPCQIVGLKTFLQSEYKNLLCVDIICHGVPSRLVWRKYVEYRCNFAKSEIEQIAFRQKDEGWKQYAVKFAFTNSTAYCQNLHKDIFMRGFLENLYLRSSCYECRFKGKERKSDITIADFWGVDWLYPEIDDDKGISAVIIHTLRGKETFDICKNKMFYKLIALDDVVKKNQNMISAVKYNPKREKFFRDLYLNNSDTVEIIKKYLSRNKTRHYLRLYLNKLGVLPVLKRFLGNMRM